MRDARLTYISNRQACFFRTTPEEKEQLQNLLKEIEKDGLGNKEPRKYTDKSRLSLFQQLYWESKERDGGRGSVSCTREYYSDDIGLNFYLSLYPIHRIEAIDTCGLYLKEIAKKLYSKSQIENRKERCRWQKIYNTFIKHCISRKILEEDLETVIKTDENIDDKKVKEYFEIIDHNTPIMVNNGMTRANSPCHRFKIKLWLLTKTNDIDFILESVDNMTEFCQPWDIEFCRYSESTHELEELGKHIISCLKDIYKNNPTEEIQKIEYYISLYLKYIGRTQWYMDYIYGVQQSIASLCGKESAARILENCGLENCDTFAASEQYPESSSSYTLKKRFPKQ